MTANQGDATMSANNHTSRSDRRPWKILLVDDHAIVRHGLSLLIGQEPDLTVCGESASADETLAILKHMQPDIAIIDISLLGSGGIELTKSVRDRYPDLPVLVLSMHDEALYAERALRAGARGYVMKQEAAETVLQAIRKVLAGELYISSRLSSRMLQDVVNGNRHEPEKFGVDTLSDRELEVFELVGRGHSTRAIAERLKLSVKTIETHRAHIKQKLNLNDASELVHRAFHWVETAGKP